jgi:hypothetical protein
MNLSHQNYLDSIILNHFSQSSLCTTLKKRSRSGMVQISPIDSKIWLYQIAPRQRPRMLVFTSFRGSTMYSKSIHPNVNVSNDFWVLITHHPPKNEVAYNVIFISNVNVSNLLTLYSPIIHSISIINNNILHNKH